MYNVIDVKGEIQKALKSITIEDLNTSILSPEQFEKFVDGLQLSTDVLSKARKQEMYSPKANIDRMEFIGDVLEKGRNSDGSQNVASSSTPTFKTNQLSAQELIASTGLFDDAARRNIMKGSLKQYLIDIFSKKVAFSLARYYMWADTEESAYTGTVLDQTDGWIKLAGNKLYGVGNGTDSADFNPEDPIAALNSVIKAMPEEAIDNKDDFEIKVDTEFEDALRDAYIERGTNLGDSALTSASGLKFKGYKVVADSVMSAGNSRAILFTKPNNMVYGLFHQVTIEDKRVPEHRKTEFYLTTEGDSHYDNEEIAVVAFLDKEKPAS